MIWIVYCLEKAYQLFRIFWSLIIEAQKVWFNLANEFFLHTWRFESILKEWKKINSIIQKIKETNKLSIKIDYSKNPHDIMT